MKITGKQGVAVVAIMGNDPKATLIGELDSSDMGDTLAEMKIRAKYKHLHYPYLYDGATQSVAGRLWTASHAPRLHLRSEPPSAI